MNVASQTSVARRCVVCSRPLPNAVKAPIAAPLCARRQVALRMSKGFADTESKSQAETPAESQATSSTDIVDKSIEDLEERVRGRKKRSKVEAKVKVVSPVVDAVTGKTEQTPIGAAETVAVQWLGFIFLVVIVEGLMLAGSGFLPEELDAWVTDNLYPNYSYTVLAFLGFSSLYGLFKVGKLPFQEQLAKSMSSKK